MSHYDEDDLDQLEESHKPFCPKCGTTDIRQSQSHRTFDQLLRAFGLRPFRCRSCRKRFYMRPPAKIESDFDAKEKEPQGVKQSPPAP